MSKNSLIVKTENLSRVFPGGVSALKNISIGINSGEWVSIMGPSGSGKTTLLNIVGCLDRPSGGSVRVEGVDITLLNESELTVFRRERIGIVFQQFHLIPYLNALENVMLAQYFHSMVDKGEALEALNRVGLKERINHLPSQLSAGEQQRVSIARAIINMPKLLLADEPTGNLDKENEEIVIEIFKTLHRDGMTLLIVTHDETVGKAGSRTVYLDHGEMIAESPVFSE